MKKTDINNEIQIKSIEAIDTKKPESIPPLVSLPLFKDTANTICDWVRENNPLYLFSVSLMLLGLYIAGREMESGGITSTLSVTGFFAIQNLYEFVMIGMALYLLKHRIQAEHGKLLLILVMVFLADLTGYQVRLSGMSQFTGSIVTSVYIVLAALKLYVVIKVLKLKAYGSRIFYVFSAFSLIWIGPKIADYLLNSVGRNGNGFIDCSNSYYSMWMIAGLIHLPLIILNWRRNNLASYEENEYLGNAATFWRWLITFPYIVMPLYLYVFAMSEQVRFITNSTPTHSIIAPWLFFAAFFAQTLWRKECEQSIGLNMADSIIMLVFLSLTLTLSQNTTLPVIGNNVLLVAGLSITWITRKNYINGIALIMVPLWYTAFRFFIAAKAAVNYLITLSKVAWAYIFMGISFVLLGLGFVISTIRSHTGKRSELPASD